MKTVLVTGGAGFIGSAVCRHLVAAGGYRVVNLDLLTYAGNLQSLKEIEADPAYRFVQGDIGDQPPPAEPASTFEDGRGRWPLGGGHRIAARVHQGPRPMAWSESAPCQTVTARPPSTTRSPAVRTRTAPPLADAWYAIISCFSSRWPQ